MFGDITAIFFLLKNHLLPTLAYSEPRWQSPQRPYLRKYKSDEKNAEYKLGLFFNFKDI